MVLEEVIEMCTEKTKLVHKDRFISQKFLSWDSFIMVFKLGPETEGDDADYDVMGPRALPDWNSGM